MKNDQKMWEIIKRYDSNTFNNDMSSLGYKIDVYQESIGTLNAEFLVNFEYLIRIMENFGFVPISAAEAEEMKMPAAIGTFEELFITMNNEIKSKRLRESNIGDALKMTENEKKISFLFNYFIFKKVRNVDAEAVFNTNIGGEDVIIEEGQKQTVAPTSDIALRIKRPRKRKKKVRIAVRSKK